MTLVVVLVIVGAVALTVVAYIRAVRSDVRSVEGYRASMEHLQRAEGTTCQAAEDRPSPMHVRVLPSSPGTTVQASPRRTVTAPHRRSTDIPFAGTARGAPRPAHLDAGPRPRLTFIDDAVADIAAPPRPPSPSVRTPPAPAAPPARATTPTRMALPSRRPRSPHRSPPPSGRLRAAAAPRSPTQLSRPPARNRTSENLSLPTRDPGPV